MSTISTHTPTTTHIGSYSTPSHFFIISAVLIGIIVLILIYFCISDTSRHAIIIGFYWLCLVLVKIILFGPALLVLLFCYIYKALVFIGKKFKNRAKIDIELQTSVVINNTYTITNVSYDTSSDMINLIFRFYSC